MLRSPCKILDSMLWSTRSVGTGANLLVKLAEGRAALVNCEWARLGIGSVHKSLEGTKVLSGSSDIDDQKGYDLEKIYAGTLVKQ